MTQNIRPDLPFHYGWIIVATGFLGIFACIGLARYALGMLLPAMGQDLHLSYTQMGIISTSNFLGYLAGILGTSHLVRRFGARFLTAAALLLSSLSMIGIGCCSSLELIVFFYILTGIGSAMANIPIMAMLSSWFSSSLRGKARRSCSQRQRGGHCVCRPGSPLAQWPERYALAIELDSAWSDGPPDCPALPACSAQPPA